MATAILPQPVPSTHPELLALAHEIANVEGLGLRTALVLAKQALEGLTAYAEGWDVWAAAQQPRCPQCGATLEHTVSYVGGRGYLSFEVCSGDGSHYSRSV